MDFEEMADIQLLYHRSQQASMDAFEPMITVMVLIKTSAWQSKKEWKQEMGDRSGKKMGEDGSESEQNVLLYTCNTVKMQN